MRYTVRYIPHAMPYAMRTVPVCYAMCLCHVLRYALCPCHAPMPCAHTTGTAMVYGDTMRSGIGTDQCIIHARCAHDQHLSNLSNAGNTHAHHAP